MKKNSFSIHNLQCSLNQERSNFQSPLITATKENKKIFDCKIVNNNFSDFFNDESTLSKNFIIYLFIYSLFTVD